MTHHGAEERIRCSGCNANNFPGVLQCWHCGASLPHARPGVPAGGVTTPRHAPRRLPIWLPILVLAVLAIAGGWLYSALVRPRMPGATMSAQELRDLERQLLRRSELQGTPVPSGPDPLEVRARRELERLKEQAGILENRQGGATREGSNPRMRISPEEWERTGRDLRGIQ